MRPEPPRLRGLYLVTPRERDTGRLLELTGQGLQGGAVAVQYRAKDAAPAEALEQALALRALCDRHHAIFIVNDSVELAMLVGADGVHLGREDGDVAVARRAMPRGILGVSCYADPARAHEAVRSGADYVAIGSVFASTTKPGAVRAPLAAIGAARAAGAPVVAIGGITPVNAVQAIAAGAEMVAVIAAVFEAPDPRAAAAAFAKLFQERQPPSHVRA
jgi:thiamine-phosphate pyrophosphorylase